MKEYLKSGDILLPQYAVEDADRWKKWAVIACDQFTSEPTYWEEAAAVSGSDPSTLSMILPEVYLSEREERTPIIHQSMDALQKAVLHTARTGMIYIARTQSDGAIREGLVAMIDLEDYEYQKGAESLIRATEGTVLERIPPRVAVRRDAPLELPHVMLLIDDPKRTVIEPLGIASDAFETAYDFDLMLGGGHILGKWIPESYVSGIEEALHALISPETIAEKYGSATLAPLLFAVGDGNHSLATAKAHYEEIKASMGAEKAATHPARYALCEVVNLHSEALRFEPIYRVVFGADADHLLHAFQSYADAASGNGIAPQSFTYLTDGKKGTVTIQNPAYQLPVGSLQAFLDDYLKSHPSVTIDYIHGEDSTEALSVNGAVGFLFSGMQKDELFKTVLYDGALPRKTFSMGHARDKRYYLEARKIR
jgi:hypothetical protein